MISEKTKKEIICIWEKYANSDRIAIDTKGNVIGDIDDARRKAIAEIRKLLDGFIDGSLPLNEFKTSLDGYNKRNNLWGFTAAKGQMFFNLLVNTAESTEKLTSLLKESISKPQTFSDALSKIDQFEKFVRIVYEKGADKRRVPKPGAVGYFLSYFWQIYDNVAWPIMYSSLINSFEELGIWKEFPSQKEEYDYFFKLNEEIKSILKAHAGQEILNWDAEHAFWSHNGNPMISQKTSVQFEPKKDETIPIKANFQISDYLIPRISNLIGLGNSSEKSSSGKGNEFEKMVCEVFKLLEFEVETLGQGTGRNPDAIIKFREEHTAFIVDAKAYSTGYSLGVDDRAIKEYISFYTPKLQKEGFKKIGFIIVSNSFKSDLNEFVNQITWNTDIKRFVLLTSDALLHLIAYKTKDNLPLTSIIDFLVGSESPVVAQNVIEGFDDI